MSEENTTPTRFIGLDIHKHYLVAIGVDAQLNQVFGPQRVLLSNLDDWRRKHLTRQDAVALEATTNAFPLYDELLPYAHSVTVVHPPQVALITRAQIMTDKIAALTLARLLAVGLLPPIWVPPQAVRDQRALSAGRAKMVRLATQAKNRLHAVLHRHHLAPPDRDPFAAAQREWWLALPVTLTERVRIQSDLDTLAFAQSQIRLFEDTFVTEAAHDDRMALLIQLPGISLVTARAVLAAIGDIRRFPSSRQLVGYAGLGGRVHDSGLTHRAGGITKAGRRDLRTPLVEAAHVASNTHPHWKAELARLEPRIGHNKAIVAIARKLLVAVWHVLSEAVADRWAEPESVARKLLQYTDRLGRPKWGVYRAVVCRKLDHRAIGYEGSGTDLIDAARNALELAGSRKVTAYLI